MKYVNLLTLVELQQALSAEEFDDFKGYLDIKIKDAELHDLKALIEELRAEGCTVSAFDSFYVGYTINQIGKEFDLLRLNQDSILNIELKQRATEDKVEKQLRRNNYYLRSLGLNIIQFTFVANTKKVFTLNAASEFYETTVPELTRFLLAHTSLPAVKIDGRFEPTKFLVSPFNTPQGFISGSYFLTRQQEQIKTQVLNSITSNTGARFISITGIAGTGKTLLAYDIVKEVMPTHEVKVVHCGNLNGGHETLKRFHWDIEPIKWFNPNTITQNTIVLLDEAQRVMPKQFEDLVNQVLATGCVCIFSYDKNQTLSLRERNNDIASKIELLTNVQSFKLSQKIRTNKNMASFIEGLFTLNSSPQISSKDDISFSYFEELEEATEHVDQIKADYEVLKFTPSQYNREHADDYSHLGKMTAHAVVGQEFDCVCVFVDEHYGYSPRGKLTYKSRTYYDAVKMLFQNLTRTRVKLHIVIVNNPTLLNRVVQLLK